MSEETPRLFTQRIKDSLSELTVAISAATNSLIVAQVSAIREIRNKQAADVIGPHIIKGLEELGYTEYNIYVEHCDVTNTVIVTAQGANKQSKVPRIN